MRKPAIALILVLVLALVAGTVGCGEETAPATLSTVSAWTGDETAQTIYGKVEGFADKSGTWVWKAVPFAKPPVGELRWKAPQEPEPWTGVREETEYCAECTQRDFTESVVGSEDCLYLNVWRPQSDEIGLPVYFWIHGGGNSLGTASTDGYNGANIAGKSDMVVVTVNYRLGPLGWFTHEALRSGEAGDEADDSGNYGTLDLVRALEWVQRNIEAFGGDPDNVTITGESAGAMNVFSLLISPLAEGLFHRAIAQSGMTVSSPVATGDDSVRDVIVKLLVNDGTASDQESAVGVLDGMSGTEVEAYLRSQTTQELLSGYESLSFGMLQFPYIFEDGAVIPEEGYDVLEAGTYPNKVPLMVGTNKEETKLFLFMDESLVADDEMYQLMASYSSDLWKAAGVDDVARKMTSHADQPDVYVYQFLWGAGGDVGESVMPDPWGFKIGASHALDIPFFFGNDNFIEFMGFFVFTEENRPGRKALSDAMMTYAAQFARTGNPNPPESDSPEWYPWTNDPGQPKSILWDADREKAIISMSSTELTVQGVHEEMGPRISGSQYPEAFDFLLEFLEGGDSLLD